MQCSFLKKCGFPSGNYSAFAQSYSISFKTQDSYSICSVWLTLSIAVKMCDGCSLQHSLQRKIVVKGKCCVQVTVCLEDKIVPRTRSTILAKNIPVEKWITSFYGAQPSSNFPFIIQQIFKWTTYIYNVLKIIDLKTMFSSNSKQHSCRKMQYVDRCNTSFMRFSLILNDSCL